MVCSTRVIRQNHGRNATKVTKNTILLRVNRLVVHWVELRITENCEFRIILYEFLKFLTENSELLSYSHHGVAVGPFRHTVKVFGQSSGF